jgi:hypothetical protein
MIVLHEMPGDTRGGKFALVPGLKEKSARIAEHARLYQYDFWNTGRYELH